MIGPRRMVVRSLLFLLLLVHGAAAGSGPARPSAVTSGGDADGFGCKACELKAAEVGRCRSIDPEAYATGLLFNPAGKKTFYKRSSCLFELARKYRDASLCAEVRERKSMFFDGSAFTRASCEQSVREALAGDPAREISDIKRLAEARWFRNGNGRDLDLHVQMSGSYPHRYGLTVLMLGDDDEESRVLWRDAYGLRGRDHQLRVRIPGPDMAAAADALGVQPPYRVRVTFALVEPGLAELAEFAAMSPRERESSVEQLLDPSALEREPR